MARRKQPYQRTSDYVPQAERSYGIKVVHRTRPNMTLLTEFFVRYTLAEANSRRDAHDPPVIPRPEVLKPASDPDFTEEGR